MIYNWTQLGINEITNLYLYGTTTTPTDLASEARIRPAGENPVPIVLDAVSFMATGPGRFAYALETAPTFPVHMPSLVIAGAIESMPPARSHFPRRRLSTPRL